MDFWQIFFSHAANALWKRPLWNLTFCARKSENREEIVAALWERPRGEDYGSTRGCKHETARKK
jgi:hypothetical protein